MILVTNNVIIIILIGLCLYLWLSKRATHKNLHELQCSLAHLQSLLATFGQANQAATSAPHSRLTCEQLLTQVLDITESEFGFIGEIHTNNKDTLLIHALHHRQWSDDARLALKRNIAEGIQCTVPNTLYGQVMASGKAIIINTPTPAPRLEGIDVEMPMLNNFLGLPIYHAKQLVGIFGIANHKGSYTQDLANQLQLFTSSYGNLILTDHTSHNLATSKHEQLHAHKMLQSVLDAIPTRVYWKDKNSIYLGCNHLFAQDAGLSTSQEVIGLKDDDLIWKQDAPRLQAEDQNILNGGPAKQAVIEHHIEPNGTHSWVKTNKLPLRNEQGDITGVIGLYDDITERRANEEELQRLTSALDETLDSVFMFEADSLRFFYVNKGAAKQIGYSTEQLMHMTPVDIKPDYDNESFIKLITPMLQGEITSTNFTTRHQHQNGNIIPVEIFLQYVAKNTEKPCFVAIVHDISERLRAEKALKNSESRQRAILENIVDGIITIDRYGIIKTFNHSAELIFGYSAEEVTGKNIKILIPEPHHSNHDTYLNNYLTTGVKRIIGIGREVEGLRKDGSTFPVDLAISEMLIDGERMFTGVIRDITERKRVEKLKNEFISTVSHELRTPLTSIKGSLGLLNGGAISEIPDKAKKILHIASSNTERLLLLINDILDIQKIESGKMDFTFQPIQVISLLKQSIESNAGYALQYDVKLSIENHISDAKIYADHERLMQVMHNLISNAIKFSPTGSTVEITATKHQKLLRISIIDHGMGIPDSFRKKIFQKFSQNDSSDSRQVGGTGLGLAISRAIVEKHKGVIDYVSEPNKGSTFFFEIEEYCD